MISNEAMDFVANWFPRHDALPEGEKQKSFGEMVEVLMDVCSLPEEQAKVELQGAIADLSNVGGIPTEEPPTEPTVLVIEPPVAKPPVVRTRRAVRPPIRVPVTKPPASKPVGGPPEDDGEILDAEFGPPSREDNIRREADEAINGFIAFSTPIVAEGEVKELIRQKARAEMKLLQMNASVADSVDLVDLEYQANNWLTIFKAVETDELTISAAEALLTFPFESRRKELEEMAKLPGAPKGQPVPPPILKSAPAQSVETLANMAIEAFLNRGTPIAAKGDLLDQIIRKTDEGIESIIKEVSNASLDTMPLWGVKAQHWLAVLKAVEPTILRISAAEVNLKEAFEKRRKALEEASEATKKPVLRVVPKKSTRVASGDFVPERPESTTGAADRLSAAGAFLKRRASAGKENDMFKNIVIMVLIGVVIAILLVAWSPDMSSLLAWLPKGKWVKWTFVVFGGTLATWGGFSNREGKLDKLALFAGSGIVLFFLGGLTFASPEQTEKAIEGVVEKVYIATNEKSEQKAEEPKKPQQEKVDPTLAMEEFDKGNPFDVPVPPQEVALAQSLKVGSWEISETDLAAIGVDTDAGAMAALGFFYDEKQVPLEEIPALRKRAVTLWGSVRSTALVNAEEVKTRRTFLFRKVGIVKSTDNGEVELAAKDDAAKATLEGHLKALGRR